MCVLGGEKCYFFEKFCLRTKWVTLYQDYFWATGDSRKDPKK